MILLRFIIIGLCLYCSCALAGEEKHASVRLLTDRYDTSGPIKLGVAFEIEPGWHIYWRTAGDSGFPIAIAIGASQNVASMALQWPLPLRHVDKFDGLLLESYIYKERAIFPLFVERRNNGQESLLQLTIEYAICKDICLTESHTLKMVLPAFNDTTISPEFASAWERIPEEKEIEASLVDAVSYADGLLDIGIRGRHVGESLFVESETNAVFHFRETIYDKTTHQTHFRFNLSNRANVDDPISLPLTVSYGLAGMYHEVTIDPSWIGLVLPDVSTMDYWEFSLILLFAWIGGLILNVMPCVLPVLSIKLMTVIKYSHYSLLQVRESFFLSAVGIISSFGLLSIVVLVLREAGQSIGWGFHFQQPYFVIFLIMVLALFAANMWGLFSLSFSVGKNGKVKKHSFIVEHFFTGMMATLLATPCTAPFLGTAVSFALSHGATEIVLIFMTMGVGLATPYLVVAVCPDVTKYMPKPGAWMGRIKMLLGVFLVLTALWLLWVLSNQLGIVVATVIAALVIGLWLNLWNSRGANIKARAAMALTLVLLAFVVPSMPIQGKTDTEDATKWVPFDTALIQSYMDEGKVVFVDITADWCLTCKANKFLVIDREEMTRLFVEHDVVLMRGDWTNKNQKIYDYLQSRGVYGIPFNAVYGPESESGINLPVILDYDVIKKAIDAAHTKKE